MTEGTLAPIFVKASTAARLLDVEMKELYQLASAGRLGDKHYIGRGTRNFRLRYDAVKAYAESLPTSPVDT